MDGQGGRAVPATKFPLSSEAQRREAEMLATQKVFGHLPNPPRFKGIFKHADEQKT